MESPGSWPGSQESLGYRCFLHVPCGSSIHLFSSQFDLFFPFPDRVVDDLNPVLNFTRREVENLLHFVEEESDPAQLSLNPSKMKESVLQLACLKYPHLITKVRTTCFLPVQHCVDRRRTAGIWLCDGDLVARRTHRCAGGNRALTRGFFYQRALPFPAVSSMHLEPPLPWTGLGTGCRAPLFSTWCCTRKVSVANPGLLPALSLGWL